MLCRQMLSEEGQFFTASFAISVGVLPDAFRGGMQGNMRVNQQAGSIRGKQQA